MAMKIDSSEYVAMQVCKKQGKSFKMPHSDLDLTGPKYTYSRPEETTQ